MGRSKDGILAAMEMELQRQFGAPVRPADPLDLYSDYTAELRDDRTSPEAPQRPAFGVKGPSRQP